MIRKVVTSAALATGLLAAMLIATGESQAYDPIPHPAGPNYRYCEVSGAGGWQIGAIRRTTSCRLAMNTFRAVLRYRTRMRGLYPGERFQVRAVNPTTRRQVTMACWVSRYTVAVDCHGSNRRTVLLGLGIAE
jgi:hypothetical protein